MLVAIVRHGKAEGASASGGDAERRLTARGERQAAWLGGALRDIVRWPAAVVASPIARAKRTGEIIAASLGVGVRFDERLATNRSVQDAVEVIEETQAAGGVETLVIVGHNPHFEALAAALTRDESCSMRTGECCVVDMLLPEREAVWMRMREEED